MGIVKNSLLTISMLIGFTALSTQAKASLLIEPHIGYIVNGNADYQTTDTEYNGPSYGARLGGQWLGLMAGLDYTHSTFTYKSKILGVSVDSDQKRDQLGVFVGYNFPILVRAWVGYNFSDKVTTTQTNSAGTNGDWNKGDGTVIGVGFTGLPFLSINLEYHVSNYDKSNDGAITPEFKNKEIVLGVSAPFTLL